MTKYINADNLINELSAACMPIYEKGITGILGDNSSIADIINEQPTADVQEARHGKWEATELMYENGCTRCSECKTDYIDYEDERGVIQWDSDIAKFIITFSTFTIDFDNVYGRELEIVGNVYDNPELLEAGEMP